MVAVIVAALLLCICIRENMAINHDHVLHSDDMTILEIISEKLVMYSYTQLKIITGNFKHKLGKGGFGTVYKGTLEDGVQVAVKVLNGDFTNKLVRRQFEAEVSLIRKTNHPNLVKLYGFCFNKHMKALVYEFMENGSLGGFLFDREKKNLIEWDKLYDIAVGTAKGVAYLHEYRQGPIIHYDIKPENVLLDASFSPKVSDFGVARFYSNNKAIVESSGFKGTLGYAAPELWLACPGSEKCDVYSFGMLLFEILGRRRNMDSRACSSQEWLPRYVWKKFEEGAMEEMFLCLGISGSDSEAAKKMALSALWCVQCQPDLRPTMSNVVKILEGMAPLRCPPNPFPQMSGDDSCHLRNGSPKGFLSKARFHINNFGKAMATPVQKVLGNRMQYLRQSEADVISF
ncbi:hypothetical protein ACLOJK_036803 [Asimina triloba]